MTLAGVSPGREADHQVHIRGWVFELKRVGRPRVDREYYRRKMGGSAAAPAPEVGPNWAAMDLPERRPPPRRG